MQSEDNVRIVDWEQLARSVGAIRDDQSEHSGTSLARRAIEKMIGVDACRSAVDHYVSHKPGCELARSILCHIHPWSAMERCYEICNEDDNTDIRRSAIELLRVVADGRVLPWVPEFLADTDQGVQTWGAGIVDQLLWSHEIEPADCSDILKTMAEHENEQVRERYEFIQSNLKSRKESA